MNAIDASLELLEPHIKDPKHRQYYKIAKSSSDLLTFLVRDILDFAQIQEQGLLLNPERVNLLQLVNECIEMIILKAQKKGI